MAPLANDPIIPERLMRLFRHIKHQNLSTGNNFIYSSEMILLVQFLATMEAVELLANDPIMLGRPIQSFRDLEHQNPSILSDLLDSARCGQIFSSNFGHQGVSGPTCK